MELRLRKKSGSDLFPRICELAAKSGYTMFFWAQQRQRILLKNFQD